MDLGGKKRIAELEAEVTNLKSWVEYLKGVDAVQLSAYVGELRAESASLAAQLETTKNELAAARRMVVETDEVALLQEVGVYRYRHPLDDAVAYKEKLKEVKDALASHVKGGQAVNAMKGWTVNNSLKEGEKMTRDLSKLMLRAYNSEADNIVRTLKPHTLDAAIGRLNKARETIAKLGKIVQIEIAENYHRWRIRELELTADYLMKVEEEKERQKEERARQREEEKALREMESEKSRLEKEQAHYQGALEKLRANGDEAAIAEIEGKIEQISAAITGIENREANIRAGHVYVISNFGSFGEHICKIGLTRRLDPVDRIRELGDASVPFNFDIHALIFSDDAVGLESRLHAHFAEQRVNLVNLRREYFYVTPREVEQAIASFGGQYLLEFHEVPDATEWRASGGAERATSLLGEHVDQGEESNVVELESAPAAPAV